MDWGIGQYERTAAELEPVAEHALALARAQPGERVLDLATGTGNAALLAARAGASVVGLDSAPRLIEVARERAGQAGLDVEFIVGDIQELPFADGAFDLVLSVFGLIFAADPGRAMHEVSRVLRPGGRAFVTAWIPAGPIDALVSNFARALAAVTGPGAERFPWHEHAAVREMAARHGLTATFHDATLPIVAASPEAYLEANERDHPFSVSGRAVLERAGTAAEVHERALAILHAANENPAAFRVTSPYRLIELHA